MSDDVGRDKHYRGVLEGDGPHVRGLMAVHSRFPTELAGLNRCYLARLTVPNRGSSTAFTWEPGSGALGVARPLADEICAWLSARLGRGPTPRRGFAVLHAVLSGRPYSFVVMPVEGHASMVGFEVALDVLPEWLDRGLRRGLRFEQESVDGIRSKDETG